ncbi:unnamed protein product [Ixodes persulcatus]
MAKKELGHTKRKGVARSTSDFGLVFAPICGPLLHLFLHLLEHLLHSLQLRLLLLQDLVFLGQLLLGQGPAMRNECTMLRLHDWLLGRWRRLAGQSFGPVVLVVQFLSHLLQVLHVTYAHEHGAQLDEVAVFWVLYLDDAPRVEAAPHLPTLDFDQLDRRAHRKGDRLLGMRRARELLHLFLVLLVFVGVAVRQRIKADPVLGYLLHYLTTHLPLETHDLLLGECVRLGNDGHNVDFVVEHLHELDVQGLEPVAEGRDEVEAAVHPVVRDVASVQPTLVAQEALKLVLNVLDDRLEAAAESTGDVPIRVIDGVPKARCIHHGKTQLDPPLFDLHSRGIQSDCLLHFSCWGGCNPTTGIGKLAFWVQVRQEQAVDKCGFSEPRLPCLH